jgi:hypothetical protein
VWFKRSSRNGTAGFKAVARLAFDPEYQLDGGSYDTFKDHNGVEPDVVFHGSWSCIRKAYKPGDGKMVTDYDAGIQAQKDALK